LHAQRNKPKTPKKHSVFLVEDSHIRGITEIKLRSSFHTIGYVKLNADLNNITSTLKSEIKNLCKNDVVVLCGGTLDVARNTSIGLSLTLQFVKNTENTNVIFIDVPQRFYLEASSFVNKEVNAFKSKLNKIIIKPYEHTSQLHFNMQRKHFTKYGLYMNGSGKDRISRLLTSRIMEQLNYSSFGDSHNHSLGG